MSITHNIQNHFIIMASHLNTSRATEILYTILELANIGLQHVIIEKLYLALYCCICTFCTIIAPEGLMISRS